MSASGTGAPAPATELSASRGGPDWMPRFGCYVHSSYAGALAEQGYDYVELAVAELLPGRPESEVGPVYERLAALPVRAEVFDRLFPPTLRLVGEGVDLARVADHVGVVFERVRRVGGDLVVWGSGPSRHVPGGYSRERAFEQLVATGKLIAREAERAGVGVVLEPLGRRYCNVITTVEEGLALLEAVGSRSLGMLADTDHMESEGDPFSRLGLVGNRLRHVHLAEAVRVQPGPMLRRRAFYSELFRELKRIGYRGRIALEADVLESGVPLGAPLAALEAWWRAVDLAY